MSAISHCPTPQPSPERTRCGLGPVGLGRLAALAALMTLALLTGCGGVDAQTPSPSTPSSEGTGSAVPSNHATTPEPADPPAEQTVTPTDEVPYDPIQRTLTGLVERPAGCTVLVVGSTRWVLTGSLAATLTVGSMMTVTGNLTHRPSTCPGENGQELEVTSAVPA